MNESLTIELPRHEWPALLANLLRLRTHSPPAAHPAAPDFPPAPVLPPAAVDALIARIAAACDVTPVDAVPLAGWFVTGRTAEYLPLDTLRGPDGRLVRRLTLGDVRAALEEVLAAELAGEYQPVRLVGADGQMYKLRVGVILDASESPPVASTEAADVQMNEPKHDALVATNSPHGALSTAI